MSAYTFDELLDKKPKELLDLIMQLQAELASTKQLVEGMEANQLTEDMVVQIIQIIADGEQTSLGKIRSLLGMFD